MLLFWLALAGFIIGMLVTYISIESDMSVKTYDVVSGIGVALIVICLVVSLVVGISYLAVTIPEVRDFEELAYERDVIDSSINIIEDYPPTSNSYILRNDLYDAAIKLNNKIRRSRRFRESVWIGGLVNEYYGDLDYIIINGKSPELYFQEK